MIELKTNSEIEEMKPAGKFVGEVLKTVKEQTAVGTNLLEIDETVKKMIQKAGATSCYVDYHPSFGNSPFGHYICTSVNDAVLHGLPHDYDLKKGDLLSLDFACELQGWACDSALSFIVGVDDEEIKNNEEYSRKQKLINTTQEALAAGIKKAKPGNRLYDISAAIGEVANRNGYSVNLEFGGHGIGRTMHEDPHVPNDAMPGRGLKLIPGMTIAIEPWFMETTDEIYQDEDGWTLCSADGSFGAHSEHTIAITETGNIILTARN